MKKHVTILLTTILALAVSAPSVLAQGKQPKPDKLHTVVWYPKKKILAQQICEEITKKYSAEGMQYAVIHANVKDTVGMGVVLASAEGIKDISGEDASRIHASDWHESIEIGLPDTEISTLVSGKDECLIVHPHVSQNRVAIRLPATDASGKTIRAGLSFSFTPYKQGEDYIPFIKRSLELRDEMAKQIPSLDALYKSVE